MGLEVVGNRPLIICSDSEATIWHKGFVTKITVNERGEIDILGSGLQYSFVKTEPEHIVIIPSVVANKMDR